MIQEKKSIPLLRNKQKNSILSGVPRFHTLRFKSTIQGQKVTFLVDGGATHKFIDVALVQRRNIHDENFEGFMVIILSNNSMECAKWLPKIQVVIGN